LIDSFIVVVVEPVELWAAGGRKTLLRGVRPRAPLAVAKDEIKSEPRAVRVIQIYRTPSNQPADPPAPIVDPVNAFPETETLALAPTEPPPALSAAPPPQKTAMDICERVHMHKQFTNGGRSWRCVR
jgi:hypothetical protein